MKLNTTLGLGNKTHIALLWFECPNNKTDIDTDNACIISHQVIHKFCY